MHRLPRLLQRLDQLLPAPAVSAHCDGPCGVYDPASARIAAEAVLSMTRKLVDLDKPLASDEEGAANTYARYVAIKEEQAQLVKDELGILWSDYFKPEHLESHPDLHTIFWTAIKTASDCKTSVDVDTAKRLLDEIEAIHHLFWATKGRDVAWVLANP
ncbi:MAG: superoxide dismutase, Ni [Acidimicrobiia bacterium]|nr:superoxide dismutase, Ni [Acidimicrobiia bacterium]